MSGSLKTHLPIQGAAKSVLKANRLRPVDGEAHWVTAAVPVGEMPPSQENTPCVSPLSIKKRLLEHLLVHGEVARQCALFEWEPPALPCPSTTLCEWHVDDAKGESSQPFPFLIEHPSFESTRLIEHLHRKRKNSLGNEHP